MDDGELRLICCTAGWMRWSRRLSRRMAGSGNRPDLGRDAGLAERRGDLAGRRGHHMGVLALRGRAAHPPNGPCQGWNRRATGRGEGTIHLRLAPVDPVLRNMEVRCRQVARPLGVNLVRPYRIEGTILCQTEQQIGQAALEQNTGIEDCNRHHGCGQKSYSSLISARLANALRRSRVCLSARAITSVRDSLWRVCTMRGCRYPL